MSKSKLTGISFRTQESLLSAILMVLEKHITRDVGSVHEECDDSDLLLVLEGTCLSMIGRDDQESLLQFKRVCPGAKIGKYAMKSTRRRAQSHEKWPLRPLKEILRDKDETRTQKERL
jgi:hypothetical protein